MRIRFFAALLSCALAPAFGGVIVDSVNAAGPQCLGPACQFVVQDTGWYFTPASTYTLTEILLDFGTTDGRTVTEEIFDTTTPALGGTLLRSASFVPASDGFAGGTFAPLVFTAGHTYFIGTLNIMGLDGMVSTSPTATNLLEAFDTGDMMFETPCNCPSSGNAILEMANTGVVTPEPASFGFLLIGGAVLLGLQYRNRAITRS